MKTLLLTFFWTFLLVPALLFSQQNKEEFFGQLNTVVIDAGHGGDDPGCHGASAHEKDIALSIALKLGGYLEEKYEDLKVVYTRKTDVFIELDERAKIANRNNADLFICIHANSASPSAFGTETFVMGNAKTESNLKAAQRENAVIMLEDNYEERYENFDPNSPESYIAMTIMQSAYQGQSIHFAEMVQQQFRERVGRKDRGVKMAPFLVLHQTTMPSVLIETGFLTNPTEERFLNSEIGQDYMASAIFRAFRDYKLEMEEKSQAIVPDSKKSEVASTPKKEQAKENTDKSEEIAKTASAMPMKKEVVNESPSNSDQVKFSAEEGLVFKIQLATTTQEIEPLAENFKGLNGVDYYQAGGLFRYTYGQEDNWEAANKVQEEVREKGFEDAFIIAFYNGKRIAVGEAVKLLKKDIN